MEVKRVARLLWGEDMPGAGHLLAESINYFLAKLLAHASEDPLHMQSYMDAESQIPFLGTGIGVGLGSCD